MLKRAELMAGLSSGIPKREKQWRQDAMFRLSSMTKEFLFLPLFWSHS